MNNETPLAEIAASLPHAAATALSECENFGAVESVLAMVRACYVYWEEDGYQFDPIQMEGILNALVVSVIPGMVATAQLTEANEKLQAALKIADLFIRGLTTTNGGSRD